MRLLSECGGVKTTVIEHAMQRSPVFEFEDALQARDFGMWVSDHFAEIKRAAESTTRSGVLHNIGQYTIGPLRFLRFNYTTGDAAGQNMTGKATLAGCEWIVRSFPGRTKYLLSSDMALCQELRLHVAYCGDRDLTHTPTPCPISSSEHL